MDYDLVVLFINIQFGKHKTAEEVWDFLMKRMSKANFTCKYKLDIDILDLKQKKGHQLWTFMVKC